MGTTPEYYQKNKEKILEYSRQKYLENPEKYLNYQREYRKKNKNIVLQKTRDKRRQRLVDAIEFLGGKCSRCLQTYDPVCYDFHHVDPSKKEFTIGENMLLGKEKLQKEIEKCILLCSNCHRLTHKELKDAD